MREIPLTKGKVALVDDEDYERVAAFKWTANASRAGDERLWRAARYAGPRADRHIVLMHRFIMDAKPGELVDHRDGNGLDNRRQNLRLATPTQNQQNRRGGFGSSRFKGVQYHKSVIKRPWTATIRVNGGTIHLGYFTTEIEAAKAYDVAAVQHFGEFARLNLPAVCTNDYGCDVEFGCDWAKPGLCTECVEVDQAAEVANA